MVITSTWTLAGRARLGWKRLARATRRCKVASKSLLKMAGRGEGSEVRAEGAATTGGPNSPLQTKEVCVQSPGKQRLGEGHSG